MSRMIDLGPNNIFQLVSDPSEKMKIIYDVIKGQQEVIVRVAEQKDDIVHVLAPRLVQGSSLLCVPTDDNFNFKSGELILQFQTNAQKYISNVPFHRDGEFVSLSMEKKLFRVQRREFFRLRLPAGFRGTIQIPELFGAPFNQSFHVVDLSGGGCKVELPPLDLDMKPGTTFKGILRLPGRPDFPVICTVKHQSKQPHRPDGRWLGLEFFYQSEPEKNRMAATVMDLYRELFARL
ncbi:MAG: PilZ domain-containing protein [Bdellovibrionaceae bacterium]|nr:PilZ domain-containing protein [Pseudobdellovibrionaceae bacterium]